MQERSPMYWNKPLLGSNLQLERDMTNMFDFSRFHVDREVNPSL